MELKLINLICLHVDLEHMLLPINSFLLLSSIWNLEFDLFLMVRFILKLCQNLMSADYRYDLLNNH